MTSEKSAGAAPKTLFQAHEYLGRQAPKRDAPLLTWQTYHELSAKVYEEMSVVDRGHHHEAMYWVTHEREKAAGFAKQIADQKRKAKRGSQSEKVD